jgi:tetratricopeptide (TPR) repeat protein
MYDEAILQYKRAIDLDNDYRLAYNYLGYAYAHKGMKEQTLEALRKYLSLCPDEVNPHDSLAEIYMNLIGDYNTAELYFKTAVQINPDFAPHKLAELYQLEGQYKKAEALLRKTLNKETLLSSGINYFLLARLYFEKGDYEQTLNLIKSGKVWLPSYVNLYWLSGLTYLKQNRLQDAEQELNQLKKIDPESKNYFHLSGQIHLANNNYHLAIQDLQKSSKMIQFISWYYYEHREFYKYALADAYFKKGELDKAIRECQEIIADNPNWARAYYLLGLNYEKNDSYENANEAYNAFLKTWQTADRDLPSIKYASQRIQSFK